MSFPTFPFGNHSLFPMSVSLVLFCESEIHSVMSDSLWPQGLHSPWNSSGQNTGVGSCSFLQGIFPTQGLNWGLPYCRWILYQLNQQGSPKITEWVTYPFSSGSSPSRNQTGLLHCRQILYQPTYQFCFVNTFIFVILHIPHINNIIYLSFSS